MESVCLPEELMTDKVILRKHDLKTAGKMFEYIDSDRQRLRRFLAWVDLIQTENDEQNYIKMSHQQWRAKTLFDYSLFELERGDYIGNVGLHTISWKNARCEIGYWVLGKYEGRGLISSAVRALESTCFELGLNRIEIRCSSVNERSARIPKRLNYSLEGTLRQNSFENEEFCDTLIFSKLKSEFFNKIEN